MIKLLYIVRRAMVVLLLMLLVLAAAWAQTIVYVGETTTLDVVPQPGDTYSWELYDDGTVDFAVVPGNCPASSASFVGSPDGASVQVEWHEPGIYFYKVTAFDITGCTMNLKIGIIEVKEARPTAIITQPEPDNICVGDLAKLEVSISAKGPWNMTITDGTNFWTITDIQETPFYFQFRPFSGAFYWVTEVSNKAGKTIIPSPKVWLDVKPRPVSSRIYQYEP
ncbi:MAG: hypothetical protein WAO52_12230 [Prolixibacteraceae bacterium]